MPDDQGYGDFACHGNPVLKTPNLDALHAQGVRFTDFHVSPTCAPTRSRPDDRPARVQDRRHAHHPRARAAEPEGHDARPGAASPPATRPASSASGTSATRPPYQPDRRGFDEVFIHGGGGIGQTYPGSCGDAPGNTYFDPAILHNGTFEKTKGYCTDVFFGQALEWIDVGRRAEAAVLRLHHAERRRTPRCKCPEDVRQALRRPGARRTSRSSSA